MGISDDDRDYIQETACGLRYLAALRLSDQVELEEMADRVEEIFAAELA